MTRATVSRERRRAEPFPAPEFSAGLHRPKLLAISELPRALPHARVEAVGRFGFSVTIWQLLPSTPDIVPAPDQDVPPVSASLEPVRRKSLLHPAGWLQRRCVQERLAAADGKKFFWPISIERSPFTGRKVKREHPMAAT